MKPLFMTVAEPLVVHPEWRRLLRTLHDAGLAREIAPGQLRARLDWHASGPPKPPAVMELLSQYYAGDGDPGRGYRRRRLELAGRGVEDGTLLRRVA